MAVIRKRCRVAVVVAVAVVAVMGVCVSALAWWQEPERVRFERIREGMTGEEAVALMVRFPDKVLPMGCDHSASGLSWPLPPNTGTVLLVWDGTDFDSVL